MKSVGRRTSGEAKSGNKNDGRDSEQGDASDLGSNPEAIKQTAVDFERNPDCMLETDFSDFNKGRSGIKEDRITSTKEDNDPGSIEDHQSEERRRGESCGDDGVKTQAINHLRSRLSSNDSSGDDIKLEEANQLNSEP